VTAKEPYTVLYKIVAVQCTWRPYARYLAWRWERKGYKIAYQPITLCKALVGAIDYNHSEA